MKKLMLILAILLTLTGGYYGIWRYRLADDVARIEATLDHHNREFRSHNRWVTLKADAVKPAGFPFASVVRVERPTLTFVWGEETYGASIPWVELSLRDAASGTYAVTYAATIEAVYAKNGQAPEEYEVRPEPAPALLLRAQGDSRQCSNFPGGMRCPPAALDDPLISFAAQLPPTLNLHITYQGNTKQVAFTLPAINIPLYQRIPAEADRPLELFVNILREAMVFQKN